MRTDQRQREIMRDQYLRNRGAAIIDGIPENLRLDGYTNLLNKYGTSQDNSTAYEYQSETIADDLELIRLYEGNGLFAKIIDRPSEESVKHGLDIDYGDADAAEYVEDSLDRIDFEDKFATAEKWARLYGGSIIVMLVDDGRGLEEPLDWKEVRSIEELRVFERAIVQPDYTSLYQFHFTDSTEDGRPFGEPERYAVFSVYGYFTVHRSRCLVFRNGRLPEQTTDANYRYWGIPEYVKIRRALRECITAHEDGVKLMERSVQAIYKMKNLANMLSTSQGENRVLARLQAIDLARGILNTVAIDNEGESYGFENFSTTGVKDVIDSTCNMLSAVTNIPQTVLFGRSPAGQNATGKSDLENYYNMVENIQKQNMKANARTVIDLILRQGVHEGKIKEAPKYKIKFAALWSMSDTEQAEVAQKRAQVNQTKAQTVSAYIDAGVLDPEEVRRRLAGEGDLEIGEIISEKDLASEEDSFSIPEDDTSPPDPDEQTETEAAEPEAANEEDSKDGSDEAADPAYGAAAVLVLRNGKVLCAARRDQQGLCGPGGHLKPGETPEEAALREAQEEFNIVPLHLIPFGELKTSQGDYMQTKLYFADRYTGTPEADGMEMIDERWVRIDDLHKEPLFPAFEESLRIFEAALRPFVKETRADGSAGSGNWGHKGVPGHRGGSAPGGGVQHRTGEKGHYSSAAKERAKAKASGVGSGSHSSGESGSSSATKARKVVQGKDISGSYKGSADIKAVAHAQGFDGLPKVVSKEEFDAAVKASGGFIAQRTYSASSQEVLEAYQDSLYNGEWQLGGKGGTHYGQGMYCAFSGRGEITDYVKGEMAHYQELYGLRHPEVKEAARNQYIDRAISNAGSELERVSLKEKILGNTTDEEYELYSTRTREQEVAFRKKAARIMEEADRKAEEGFSIVETMTLHPSANVAEIQELKRVKKEDAPTFQDMDIGVYAALRGYDAIKVGGDDESVAYAVILNRTKVIFADGSAHHDSKDESVIVFRFGNDGVLYAFRHKEVIGWVDVSEGDVVESHDGSSGSGNWGHEGVPGQLGGSAPGGGVANRKGTLESGYTSEAKERAKEKAQAKSNSAAGGSSGGSSSSSGQSEGSHEKLVSPKRPKKKDFDDEDNYWEARDAYREERKKYEAELERRVEAAASRERKYDTFEKASAWAKENGVDLSGMDPSKVDPLLYDDMISVYDEMFAKYPQVKALQDSYKQWGVYTDPDAAEYLFAASAGLQIGRAWADYRHGVEECLDGQASGFLTYGDGTMKTVLRHEFGHSLEHSVKQQFRTIDMDYYRQKEEVDRRHGLLLQYESELVDVTKRYCKTEYAFTNKGEAFAEGFAEYSSNPKSEYGKAFGEFLERWL